ncbi:hypothetical protein F2Q69_00047952 [Brassica cretica]|uniref:Uncharacterized protein n=1 Tax=Brassica cretica TaxID=69181 RepID=A0A8S9PZX4_BRACR|nr:hypothetical protein F2Q69_00047952 [Brassica cretica]
MLGVFKAPYQILEEEKRVRVDEVAPPGHSASRAGASPRSERSLRISKVVDERLSSERVCYLAARGRSRLERVAYLAPVGRSSSSTRPMIIFYFFLNHNAPKHLQSLHSTLQHLIRAMHAIWTLKKPNS